MGLNVNASCPIAVTKVYVRERLPFEVQDSDYVIIPQGVRCHPYLSLGLPLCQRCCIWLSSSIHVRRDVMLRLVRFIESRIIYIMPRLGVRITVQIRVVTDEAWVTKILTKFVWSYPKRISEQLLYLTIAVAVIRNAVVVCPDDYL